MVALSIRTGIPFPELAALDDSTLATYFDLLDDTDRE